MKSNHTNTRATNIAGGVCVTTTTATYTSNAHIRHTTPRTTTTTTRNAIMPYDSTHTNAVITHMTAEMVIVRRIVFTSRIGSNIHTTAPANASTHANTTTQHKGTPSTDTSNNTNGMSTPATTLMDLLI